MAMPRARKPWGLYARARSIFPRCVRVRVQTWLKCILAGGKRRHRRRHDESGNCKELSFAGRDGARARPVRTATRSIRSSRRVLGRTAGDLALRPDCRALSAANRLPGCRWCPELRRALGGSMPIGGDHRPIGRPRWCRRNPAAQPGKLSDCRPRLSWCCASSGADRPPLPPTTGSRRSFATRVASRW